MVAFKDKPILENVQTAADWSAYLAGAPEISGVRVKLRKKGSTKPGLTRTEAVEVALCHGWIDSQAGALDADYSLQAFTPRRPKGVWSQVNRDIVERLIATGRMLPTGQAEVDRAKADGRWAVAYRQKDAPVPDDFRAALDADASAAAFFATLTGSARFAFLFRLQQAKRPATREKRIGEYIERRGRGETLR
jgi:uncharacterized protein YdeI (YjbR/CyaY-like superfamily)